jgi:predicted TIM-barrel fold metal-dependent hydrolase
MDRRQFVKTSGLGLAGGALAKVENTGSEDKPVNESSKKTAPGGRVLFHCHCFPPNEQRFPRDPANGLYPGSPEHLADFANRLGFSKAVALSPFEVPQGRCTSRVGKGVDGIKWLEEQSAGVMDRLHLFASLDPSKKESPARLGELHGRGFKGVKFHPVICRFSIDPDRDGEFYNTLEGLGMPLLIHTGVFSSGMPWPLELYHPLRIDKLANRFPGIPLILAHGGGAAFCREVLGVLQAHSNAYLDLTHTLDEKYAWHIPRPDMEQFFARIGPGRIIYGVDYPWYNADDYNRDLAFFGTLGLSSNELVQVLGGNFENILAA